MPSAGNGHDPQAPLLISGCIIVKNNASTIAACLESAAPLVDEMVVYDTGAEDNTIEIARDHGARIIDGYWDDHFGRAHNDAAAHCVGDWVFALAADDIVACDDIAAVRSHLAMFSEWVRDAERGAGSEDHPVLDCLQVTVEDTVGLGLSSTSRNVSTRFLRESVCHRIGRVHTQLARRDGKVLTGAYLPLVTIRHAGYALGAEVGSEKSERNLRLAAMQLEDPRDQIDPDGAVITFARSLMCADRPAEALPHLLRIAESDAPAFHRRFAYRLAAGIHRDAGDYEEASRLISRYRALCASPLRADTLDGGILVDRGLFEEGYALLSTIDHDFKDDDGSDFGPHSVAPDRARALAGMNRYDEAAALVIGVLRDRGVIDVDLETLVSYARDGGVPLSEIASAIPGERIVPWLGQIANLDGSGADEILDALHNRFPDLLAVLVTACTFVAPNLDVERALVWSRRVRRAGVPEACPLLAVASDESRDRPSRALCALVALGAFADPRAREASAANLAALPDDGDRRAALDAASRIAQSGFLQ